MSSSKAYLSKLKASLEKSRQYTRAKIPRSGGKRKRQLTSPLPLQSSRATRNAQKKLHELQSKDYSEESSENNDVLTSSSTDVEEETNNLRRYHQSTSKPYPSNRSNFSPTTQRILNAGRVTDSTTLPNYTALQDHRNGMSLSHQSATRTDPEVLGSLNAINSQLGELLNRLEQPPTTYSTHHRHTTPTWSPDNDMQVPRASAIKTSRYSMQKYIMYMHVRVYV